ncbi:hypothetical protein H1C71_008818, partial [Ictidomys tridecemlineatus]|uniref:G-protein coupled receptors family 1 profile domain-containing protein n=1 Tax=Ictidomys tridecemlineatus TaxID=43179 RepID=A0A287CU75_ICTTR
MESQRNCSSYFYYFLSHLSSMDICYTSFVTSKLIGDQLVGRNTISYGYCMWQVVMMRFFGLIEVLILTAMAFDHYVAICKPLPYMIIMSRTRCSVLILAAWAGGAVHSFSKFCMIVQLPFCGPNTIDHYYCDIFPLLKIACTDTYLTGVFMVANSGLVALVTFILLFGPYVVILFTLRNHSAEGRPPNTFPEDKIFALFYTIIAPMFNPLIYTLPNTEMKKAMRKVWCQKVF